MRTVPGSFTGSPTPSGSLPSSTCRNSNQERASAGSATTAEDTPGGGKDFQTKYMRINVGPQHPSPHGVLRLVVDLDGERVAKIVPQIGYLHTGFEKTMENRTYQQNVTYAPRMDYVHGFGHELAYVLSAEKLIGARLPERAERVRVILTELNRIASHLIWYGPMGLDAGGMGQFLYAVRDRGDRRALAELRRLLGDLRAGERDLLVSLLWPRPRIPGLVPGHQARVEVGVEEYRSGLRANGRAASE